MLPKFLFSLIFNCGFLDISAVDDFEQFSWGWGGEGGIVLNFKDEENSNFLF